MGALCVVLRAVNRLIPWHKESSDNCNAGFEACSLTLPSNKIPNIPVGMGPPTTTEPLAIWYLDDSVHMS